MPSNVSWDPATQTLTAGASGTGTTISTVLVWVVRGLAIVLTVVFFLGSLVLGDSPAWLVLVVPPLAWLGTKRLAGSSRDQEASWVVTLDRGGLAWSDVGRSPGRLQWQEVAALVPGNQWTYHGDTHYQARWLEAVDQEGRSHRLPGVFSDQRWPAIVAAGRAHGVVPDHVDVTALDL